MSDAADAAEAAAVIAAAVVRRRVRRRSVWSPGSARRSRYVLLYISSLRNVLEAFTSVLLITRY